MEQNKSERYREYFGESMTNATIERLRKVGDSEEVIAQRLEQWADGEEYRRARRAGMADRDANDLVYKNQLRRNGESEESIAEKLASLARYRASKQRKSTIRNIFVALPVVAGLLAFAYCAKEMGNTNSPSGATAQEGEEISITLESNSVFMPCGSTPATLDELIKWGGITPDRDEVRRIVLTTDSVLLNNGDRVKVLERGFIKSKVRVLGRDKECWVPTEAIRKY